MSDDECSRYVELKPIMICPNCNRLYPKLRLPLLTVCPECVITNERDEVKEKIIISQVGEHE